MNPPTQPTIERACLILGRIMDRLTFHPTLREITTEEMGRGYSVTITVRVSRPDMARMIGKQGATIRALSALLAAIGAKSGLSIALRLAEPWEAEPDQHGKFRPCNHWDADPTRRLLQDCCDAMFSSPAVVRIEDGRACCSLAEISIGNLVDRRTVAAVEKSLAWIANVLGKSEGRLLTLEIVNRT